MQHVAVGAHETWFEEPDIIRLNLVGDVSVDEGRGLNDASREFAEGLSHFFYIIDLSKLGLLPAQVRKEVSATLQNLPLRGTVLYKASLQARVTAKLLLTAVNLFKGTRNLNPVGFADTLEDAHAWLAKRRAALVEEGLLEVAVQ